MVCEPHGANKSPIVAGACLYLNAVDNNAIGTIKSAFMRKHFSGQLANRCAIICLQSVPPAELAVAQIDKAMAEVHQKMYKNYQEIEQQTPVVVGFPKLKITSLSRDVPQIISL